MQTNALIVWVYGAVVLAGGIIGWLKARSRPSLIFGVIFGVALIVVGFGIRQGRESDVVVAAVLTGLLAAIMGIRFAKTGKFMPAGLLTILSAVVLVTLLLRR
jgi:uncharacterized membrane protein (UPF0136 family)